MLLLFLLWQSILWRQNCFLVSDKVLPYSAMLEHDLGSIRWFANNKPTLPYFCQDGLGLYLCYSMLQSREGLVRQLSQNTAASYRHICQPLSDQCHSCTTREHCLDLRSRLFENTIVPPNNTPFLPSLSLSRSIPQSPGNQSPHQCSCASQRIARGVLALFFNTCFAL